MKHRTLLILLITSSRLCVTPIAAEPPEDTGTYRLYPGIAAYVNNPKGEAFDLSIELRD